MTEFLDEIFSTKQLARDSDALANWGRDWTRDKSPAPSAVVFPDTAEQVQALVRKAVETGTALVPSGGRTGLSGGAVAANGEVVVSFDKMNKIIDFDETDRSVRCQSGVVTASLQNFAAEHNLMYPCLLYTSPSPRDLSTSRMPSSA